MKKIVLCGVVWLGLWCAGASADTVIADVQLTQPQAGQYLLRLRSSEPQAFDVLPGATAKLANVRLHNTRIGKLPKLAVSGFGTVKLTAEPQRGSVLLRVTAYSGYTIRVRQGVDPNVVEVTMRK